MATKPLLVSTFDPEASLPLALAHAIGAEWLVYERRAFPGDETYLRLLRDCRDRDVVVVADLRRADSQLIELYLLCEALRDLGAKRRLLVAPYLAYMRQDARFAPGEALTSRYIANLLSGACEALVTVDPHLHRYASLDELYSVETHVVSSAPATARWLTGQLDRAILVGPDDESAQWVDAVARHTGWPSVILDKVRHGDRDVEVDLDASHRDALRSHQAVILDDIISTGRTMEATLKRLAALEPPTQPLCVGVHAVFADAGIVERLETAGAAAVVTSTTLDHPSNRINVCPELAQTCLELIES